MLHRKLVNLAGAVLLSAMIVGCGSTYNPSTPSTGGSFATGNLITIVQDVPACDAITAAVVVNNFNFTNSDSATVQPYLATTASFAPEVQYNSLFVSDAGWNL
jgi:hypothetical protein